MLTRKILSNVMVMFSIMIVSLPSPIVSSPVVIVPIQQSQLCGTWYDPGLSSSFKCTFIEACSIWRAERVEFFADGSFKSYITYGPSSSTCSPDSSTAFLEYTRIGTYSLSNTTQFGNFTHITYQTDRYFVTPLKDNTNPPYGSLASPSCDMTTTTLLNNAVYGCPCNGTWERTVSRNITYVGSNACTAATCPYFPNSNLYGNLLLTNETSTGTLQLILTSTSTSSALGWSANDTSFVLANTGADCRESMDSTGSNHAMHNAHAGPISIVGIMLMMIAIMFQ